MNSRNRLKIRNFLRFSTLASALGSIMMIVSLFNPISPFITQSLSKYSNPIFLTQLVIIFATPAIIITSLIIGFMNIKMSYFKQVCIGLLIFGFSGTSIMFVIENIYLILLFRFMTGIGAAFVYSGCYGIAKSLRPKIRVLFFSINTCVTEVFGIIFIMLSSYIAINFGWKYIFIIFLVPTMSGILFYNVFKSYTKGSFLDDDNNILPAEEGHGAEITIYKTNYTWFVSIVFAILFFWILNASFQINLSQFLEQRNIYSPKLASIILSINLGFALFGNLLNNKMVDIFGYSYSSIISMMCSAIFLMMLYFSEHIIFYYMVSGILGVSIGVFTANSSPWLLASVAKKHSQIAINLVTVMIYFGFFLSPFVLMLIRNFLSLSPSEAYVLLSIIVFAYCSYILFTKSRFNIVD